MSQIFELIPKVMAEIGGVPKTHKNSQQNYSFRGIEDMLLAAHPAFIKHGVFCVPTVTDRQEYRFEKTNSEGRVSVWLHVTLTIRHEFYAPDGSSISVTTVGEGLDNSDKASAKSMSMALKYALIELFCVPTADLEEADRSSPEQGKTVTLTRPQPPVILPDGSTVRELETVPEGPVFISTEKRSYLSRRFRESLKEELRPQANELRHDALIALHQSKLFKSRFLDDSGNPTQDLILESDYDNVGRALVKAARSL